MTAGGEKVNFHFQKLATGISNKSHEFFILSLQYPGA